MADLPPLREVIRAHGLRAEKALGQNFLLDQNITDKIVRLSGKVSGIHAVEIGPGPGGLTRAILDSEMAQLVAVEFDPRAVGALQDLVTAYGADRFQILEADALEVLPYALVPAPRAVLSNLPYNISTVLLLKWLAHIRVDKDVYAFMSLMFQKEVGDRILAQVGTKAYGRLSVMAQWLCTVRRLFDLPPSAFTPPPKVKSSVIHFVPKTLGETAPKFETMEKILAAAFGQRRKMIRGSLSDYAAAIEQVGIDPTLRAEDVPVADYEALAVAFEALSSP
ncbi:MAG: 16S rRNA (adenine(1518)-N(6)/adenine(1519)-N(6))-dimethyltransferase RsmA [Pseudobdellovibrionaceae bacterium]|jgi:16S rRNA (adenine1518-N6/adenine1519-N6)-dimethyltransferase|nr:16S rRNA (adenine(1518)-N(6)/adenine(1519)-N(6))-dimethyltransferase RsmA [Pseudobdellovibrionaceae bacterium]